MCRSLLFEIIKYLRVGLELPREKDSEVVNESRVVLY